MNKIIFANLLFFVIYIAVTNIDRKFSFASTGEVDAAQGKTDEKVLVGKSESRKADSKSVSPVGGNDKLESEGFNTVLSTAAPYTENSSWKREKFFPKHSRTRYAPSREEFVKKMVIPPSDVKVACYCGSYHSGEEENPKTKVQAGYVQNIQEGLSLEGITGNCAFGVVYVQQILIRQDDGSGTTRIRSDRMPGVNLIWSQTHTRFEVWLPPIEVHNSALYYPQTLDELFEVMFGYTGDVDYDSIIAAIPSSYFIQVHVGGMPNAPPGTQTLRGYGCCAHSILYEGFESELGIGLWAHEFGHGGNLNHSNSEFSEVSADAPAKYHEENLMHSFLAEDKYRLHPSQGMAFWETVIRAGQMFPTNEVMFVRRGEQYLVLWGSFEGCSYSLERSSDLGHTDPWMPGPMVPGINWVMQADVTVDTQTHNQKFYRIVAQ